jgi:hypothetical protein
MASGLGTPVMTKGTLSAPAASQTTSPKCSVVARRSVRWMPMSFFGPQTDLLPTCGRIAPRRPRCKDTSAGALTLQRC